MAKTRSRLREANAAAVFAAMGDETRLRIVTRLANGEPCSISQLTDGMAMSRQAVTKHLQILKSVGLVHFTKAGRESLCELVPGAFVDIKDYLDFVSGQWDDTLARLKSFVEGR